MRLTAEQLHAFVTEAGFVILHGVLDPAQLAAACDRMWAGARPAGDLGRALPPGGADRAGRLPRRLGERRRRLHLEGPQEWRR